MARTKITPRLIAPAPPGKPSGPVKGGTHVIPQKALGCPLLRVNYLEGREGIRDKDREVTDMFKVVHTSTLEGDDLDDEALELVEACIDACSDAADTLVEGGGHRFDDEYLQEHGSFGMATIILHTVASAGPGEAPFGVTSALLPLYPPTRAGERPILCKTNKDVGDLIALIRPDIDSEDAASTPVGGYMARYQGENIVFLFPDTLVGHAWEHPLLGSVLDREEEDDEAARAVKAKLCGGDGFSRSQHKITLGKFKFCMPEVLEERPELVNAFFQTKKRKHAGTDDGPVDLRFVPRQRTAAAPAVLSAPGGVLDEFLTKLNAFKGDTSNGWSGYFAISFMRSMRDELGPKAVDDVLRPYMSLPPQALLAVFQDDGCVETIVQTAAGEQDASYNTLMDLADALRGVCTVGLA